MYVRNIYRRIAKKQGVCVANSKYSSQTKGRERRSLLKIEKFIKTFWRVKNEVR